MIIGTLFLPICNKNYIIEQWEETVRGLNLPKDKMKVVLVDATNGASVGKKAAIIIESLGFAKSHIVKFNQLPTPDIRKGWKLYKTMGERVGETYDMGTYHAEGEIFLCLEDDIKAPPNSFLYLIEKMNSDNNIGIVGGCTYKKKPNNTSSMISWSIDTGEYIDDERDELPYSDKVRAVPFGIFATYTRVIKHFNHKSSVLLDNASPDIAYCRHLRFKYGLESHMVFDVKTQHLFKRNGRVQLSGKYECPTRDVDPLWTVPEFTNKSKKNRVDGEPIFLVSSSGRSGSTLIQRLISSHDGIKILGEPQGALEEIFRHSIKMVEINHKGVVQTGQSEFDKFGYRGWIANLPAANITNVKKYIKKQITQHFKQGISKVWGIKFIQLSSKSINRLHTLYPDATFIYLFRDIKEVGKSYNKKRGWWKTGTYDSWVINSNRLLDYIKALPSNMHSIILDFDRVIEDKQYLVNHLEDELNIKTGSLDKKILDVHISSFNDTPKYYS